MIGIFIVAFQKVKTYYICAFWPIVSWYWRTSTSENS